MYLCYTLPLEIPNAVRFSKGILHTLDKDHLPIECHISAKTMVGGVEGTFKTSLVICYRIEPERLNIFDDDLLGYIMENCTLGMDGTPAVNCQITEMKFWIKHVKQPQKTCPKCNLTLTAPNYARHLNSHDDICGICQLVIRGDLEEHKRNCMIV